jgi:predicted Zn-dependent protease
MMQAGVNPAGLADFLYKMASQNENAYNMYWLHSHPESKERAQKLTEYVQGRLAKPLRLISDSSWRGIKSGVQKLNEND